MCAQLNAIKDTLDGDDPKGPSFELREVKKPDHPTTLTTLEDYENAPVGTVVSVGGKSIWTKAYSNDWITLRASLNRLDRHMADTERQVLRWGTSDKRGE